MTELPPCDVAIVGAGIAGTALALALSGHGLRIVLIEAQGTERTALPAALSLESFDPRVVALNPRSRAVLQGLDAWQAVADYRLCAYLPYAGMGLWASRHCCHSASGAPSPGNGLAALSAQRSAGVSALAVECVRALLFDCLVVAVRACRGRAGAGRGRILCRAGAGL